MHQITVRQTHKCTLVRKFPLTDGTKCQLGDQKAPRLAAHVLLFLLNVLRIVKSFENLHFTLLLELVVEGDLEELLEAEEGNVVGENLEEEEKY